VEAGTSKVLQDIDLKGKTALVTGAGRGIGREIALQLAQRGADIAVVDVEHETAEKAAREIGELGVKANAYDCDVSSLPGVEQLAEVVSRDFEHIDILVNNAGITRDTLALRMKDADWDAVLDTNLKAVFRACRAVMRTMMKQRYGRIVNITSVVGASGNAGQANYAAAKAGVAGMTRALARELGSRGVTVNCVAPGFIATDMTDRLPEAQKVALLAQIPLGRLGSPQEIAAAVSFLASPAAGYVTGTELHVNGGMFMN